MEIVKVKKSELLTIVQTNRDKHRAIFLEAVDGYREQVIKVLEERLEDAKKGRRINISINLPTPMDQTKEYDRVLEMLKMSVDDVIELNSIEFAQYVMDDWRWKDQFTASNSTYTKSVQW